MGHRIRVEVVLTLADDLTAGPNSVELDEVHDADLSADGLASLVVQTIQGRAAKRRAERGR
jgi:hypothetical protein